MAQSETQVEQLVREHHKLVHHAVNHYLKRYYVGTMEREDLVSWGMIGLVHAARAWDPERAASFSTLACKVIERMIIRGVRREWNPDEAAATVSLDEPVFGEVDGAHESRIVDLIAGDEDVEQELLDGETRAAVRSAVAQLPLQQRRLIERRFFEEIPLTELADELGLSRQGVYVRQRIILRRLRAALSSLRHTNTEEQDDDHESADRDRAGSPHELDRGIGSDGDGASMEGPGANALRPAAAAGYDRSRVLPPGASRGGRSV
jgi:RNA polymerase sigma factor (sigma-70 family)